MQGQTLLFGKGLFKKNNTSSDSINSVGLITLIS